MYNADPTLIDKFETSLQTKSENTDPRPLVYITRNKTAITSQRYWEKQRITSTVGTRSSIAVRRPEGSLLGDMIFTAQVESGTAIIRKAEPRMNLADMEWIQVATIPNVSELSIMFDGYMVMRDNIVEAYTTGDLPIVFYVDNSTSLKCWNMNNDAEFTISDTAYNVASVRGLYSEAAGLDDGIWVFYTNSLGELWEARVLNDEVAELTEITLKPSGVTGWEDVWATLTFDYRVALQLKGDDGNVHTLMSYSRPGGFSNIEYIRLTGATVTGRFGFIPPNPVSAKATEVNFSPNKTIELQFDGPVYNVSNADIGNITLISNYGIAPVENHPHSITQGVDQTKALLHFNTLGNVVEPIVLTGQSVVMGSSNLGCDDFNLALNIFEMTGTYHDSDNYIAIVSAEVSGTLEKAFSGNAYLNEYLTIETATASGQLFALEFVPGYLQEYLTITSATCSGVLADINGVPL